MSSERTFRLNKLVRDGVVESNLQQGIQTQYETLEGSDLLDALIEKIKEEAEEVSKASTREERVKELQSIIDIARAAIEATGITVVDHETHTFRQGHFVHTVTVPEGNAWFEYYDSQPDRFPEITA